MNSQLIKSFLALVLIFASGQIFADTAPPTVRVDYYHSGNAESEMFSLHQVVIEPLPWPGHPGKPLDTVRRGYFMLIPVRVTIVISKSLIC